jgi:hypothetical protein
MRSPLPDPTARGPGDLPRSEGPLSILASPERLIGGHSRLTTKEEGAMTYLLLAYYDEMTFFYGAEFE